MLGAYWARLGSAVAMIVLMLLGCSRATEDSEPVESLMQALHAGAGGAGGATPGSGGTAGAPGERACSVTSDCGTSCQLCNSLTGFCEATNEGLACTDCTKGGTCSAGSCVGSGPANKNTVCRPAVGDCDAAEECDGSSPLCPPDEYESSDTQCRAKDGDCDVAETCTGTSPDCPADVYENTMRVCKTKNGVCDADDVCDGASPDCEPKFEPATTVCRAQNFDNCDAAVHCTGSTTSCPSDINAPEGTPCNDGNACTQTDTCNASGSCNGSNPVVCTALSQCHNAGTCNPLDGSCSNPPKSNGSACDDGIACTVNDTCNGSGSCSAGSANNALCASFACGFSYCDTIEGCKVDASVAAGQPCRNSEGPCDVAEVCDGVSPTCPTDVFVEAGTVCQSASCSSAVQQSEAQCNGSSAACVAPADIQCSPFVCGATACLSSCSGDQHCLPQFYCSEGSCLPRVGAGQPCTESSQCSVSSPNCVDGVCCNSTCNGQCEACNVAGMLGTCSPVSGAPVGSRTGCASDGSSCGGSCNGSNRTSCGFPTTTTECAPPGCDPATNIAAEASFCNGAGMCSASSTVECSPYTCGAIQCRGDCTVDAHCTAGSYCNAGLCVPRLEAGGSCTQASQCDSGHCVDGVCCNSACTGQCEACNVQGNVGSCLAVTGAPAGGRAACNGSGTPCEGSCNGTLRTACAYPGTQTQCRQPSCSDGVATLGATCSGGGLCPAAQTQTCPDGTCAGDRCGGAECVVNADCDMPNICSAGICVPPRGSGQACSTNFECSSSHCVDGVCCSSACTGQCEACDVAGSEGTCSPVPSGEAPRGSRAGCTTDGSVCGGSCDGTTRNGCAYPTGNTCRSGSCSGGAGDAVAIVEAICQGTGSCPGLREQSCGADACVGTLCDGPCATDSSACAQGEFCSAGVCVATQPSGQPCGSADECQSGICADGVCCDTACSGQCEACNVAGSTGTCSPVTGSVRGGRPACGGSGPCAASCDGANVQTCMFPSASTTCGDAACFDGVQTAAASCDGQGSCTDGEPTSCESTSCNGAECANVCSVDTDCLSGRVCREGQCITPLGIQAVDEGTCGCRAVGAPMRSGPWAWLALAAVLAIRAPRRRQARTRAY